MLSKVPALLLLTITCLLVPTYDNLLSHRVRLACPFFRGGGCGHDGEAIPVIPAGAASFGWTVNFRSLLSGCSVAYLPEFLLLQNIYSHDVAR
jgi:hypothetical protein